MQIIHNIASAKEKTTFHTDINNLLSNEPNCGHTMYLVPFLMIPENTNQISNGAAKYVLFFKFSIQLIFYYMLICSHWLLMTLTVLLPVSYGKASHFSLPTCRFITCLFISEFHTKISHFKYTQV